MPFFPRSKRRGRGRRREDDGVRSVAFEIDDLEFVQASDDIGLLRVGGRWTAPVSRALSDIVLVVDRDGELLELAPLPDMNGFLPIATQAGEEWRGAFTMTVEVAEDPRTALALVAGEDARVALPRPGEWAEAQREKAEREAEAEAEEESPLVADLVAKLEEVARLEDEVDAEDEEPDFHEEPDVAAEPDIVDELEPEPVEPYFESDEDPAEPVLEERLPDPEVAELRAELDLRRMQVEEMRVELDAARAEAEDERRRREAVEGEIQRRSSVEEDLRNAIATQEAELASAAAQASQRARQAERRRDLTGSANGEHPESPRQRPADEDFLARLERARRASEAASP
jgi:hypothetical protein